jgi:lysophospholipid acyltransferase (LPLAT)-like uncharacterized protein
MKIRLDHPLWQRWAPVLVRTLVQGLLNTCSVQLEGDPEAVHLMRTAAPAIFATWHCHLLFLLYYAKHLYAESRPLVIMASPSRDGQFIGEVARGLGLVVCPGSRRKGGVQALQRMAAYGRRGHACGLAADGSRGPARVAQKGVLYLARETQVPIIPVAVAASRKITFRTWDRFESPLPLSRLAVLVGEPLRVLPADRGPALEVRRLDLEDRLNELFRQSRSFFAR